MPAGDLPPALQRLIGLSLRRQRQITSFLAGLSLFYHIVLFFLPPPYSASLYIWPLSFGTVLSVLGFWVSLRLENLRTFTNLALGIMLVWIVSDMRVGLLAHHGVTVWMSLDLLLVSLIFLALLPVTLGLLATLLAFVGFVVVAALAGPLDVVLLLNLSFILLIAAYLTLHGSYISSERAQNVKLRQELRFDGLTGVLTRQSIEEELRLLCESTPLLAMLMLVDLDYFKQVNDQHGHLVGDQALQQVAQAVQDEIGPDNFVGRWGGEEFMVLVKVASAAEGEQVAHRLRLRVSELHLHHAGLPPLTISIGAVMLRPTQTPAQHIEEADMRLYAAKAAGRNRVMTAGQAVAF